MNILCLKCTFGNLILEASLASLCVSSPAFVLDASKKNQFLPLGKLEEELWHCCLAFMAGHRHALYTVHCAVHQQPWQQQQKIQVGGKALRCQHSTSRSSLGKRVTATLEKQIDQKKKKLKAKEIKSRGVQAEQEGVPTSKQTCLLPGCICYISGTPPSESSSGFLAHQLEFEADCILPAASPSSFLILIHQVSKA